MKNPKLIFAIVLGVVFCFAGYNLWSYFKEQQAIQAEEDRQAAERRLQREQERQAREVAQEEERRQQESEAEAQRLEEERLAEERRAEREAEEAARRAEAERVRAEREAARLAELTERARSLRHIEEVPQEVIEQIWGVSSQYIVDHPEEFLEQTFDENTFGPRTNFERLIHGDTNTLMLFAAVTQDTDHLQALLDIGMDINGANKMGFTPLMFAAAYNTPEVVTFLLEQGADISAKAYVMDVTPLHVAALWNPKPDVIDALLAGGGQIEALTENDITPVVLACSDNQNLEVAERLAQRGADISVYAPDGLSVQAVCQRRISGEGDQYIMITEEVNERIIKALRP